MSREDFAALKDLYLLLNRGVPSAAKQIKAFHAKALRASSGHKIDKGKKGTFARGACFAGGSHFAGIIS